MTTRRSPPGTGSRSRRSPRPVACSGRRATRPPPHGPRRRSRTACTTATTGVLRRSWKDDRAVGEGVLEDYAHLADGLLALYETTFDERWFATARGLMDRVLERFADPPAGSSTRPTITSSSSPVRRTHRTTPFPSGAAMATTVLLRLAAWTGEGRYRAAAERALGTVAGYLARYPTGFAQWLQAATFATADVVEVAVVGDSGRRGDHRAHRTGLVDVAAVPGAGASRRRRAWRRRRCRSSPIGSPSMAGPPPTSVVASRAGCRSRMPRRWSSNSRKSQRARAPRRDRRGRPGGRRTAGRGDGRAGPSRAGRPGGPPGPSAGDDGLRAGRPRLSRAAAWMPATRIHGSSPARRSRPTPRRRRSAAT